jgi:dienelactone hydrolase
MKRPNKDFQVKVYLNVGHEFMNDTNPTMYNKEVADNAWEKALQILKKQL